MDALIVKNVSDRNLTFSRLGLALEPNAVADLSARFKPEQLASEPAIQAFLDRQVLSKLTPDQYAVLLKQRQQVSPSEGAVAKAINNAAVVEPPAGESIAPVNDDEVKKNDNTTAAESLSDVHKEKVVLIQQKIDPIDPVKPVVAQPLEQGENVTLAPASAPIQAPEAPKKKRGRPRKVKPVEETASSSALPTPIVALPVVAPVVVEEGVSVASAEPETQATPEIQ